MKSGKSIIMAVLAAMLAFSSCEKEKEQLHNSCNVIRGFVEKADQM